MRPFLPLIVFLAYAGLSVVMTWPIGGHLGTHFPGSSGDIWVHFWTFNWVKEALLTGQNVFFTDLTFYPAGVSLLTHNIAWVQVGMWLPLQALLGGATGFGVVYLLTIALNGFTTYLLACDVTRSRWAGFVAGLVVAFWPYNLSHHDHPNGIFVAAVPLALLALRRLWCDGRWLHMVLAAVAIALVGLVRWQHLMIGFFLIGGYVVYQLVVMPGQERAVTLQGWLAVRRRPFLSVVAVAGLSLLLMAPLLAPVLINQVTRENPGDLFVEEVAAQTDLLAYFLPSRYHPWWGDPAFELALANNLGVNVVYSPFLGYTVLLLLGYAVIKRWREAQFWGGMTILYMVLALGPTLRVGGRVFEVPLPYGWIDDFFLVKAIRHADRLNYMLGIPVAMLVGLAVQQLPQRLKLRGGMAVVPFLVVGFLILGEYAARYPLFSLHVPAWYETLAEEPGTFAILGMPYDRFGPDKMYMFYQLAHGKPLVNGKIARPPREAFVLRDSIPFLTAVEGKQTVPELVNVGHQWRLLYEAGVRYVVFHKNRYGTEQLVAWQNWLGIPPLYEDGEVLVYLTAVEVGEDVPLTQVLLATETGEMGVVEASVAPLTVGQEGWLEVDSRWGSRMALMRDYDVCVQLWATIMAQEVCQPVSVDWPTDMWQADEIVDPASYLLNVDPFLDAGVYEVGLQLVDSESGQAVGERAAVGQVAVETIPRQFTVPTPSLLTDVRWEDKIGLVGYDISSNEGAMEVTFYWQALRRMASSYKLFLHLYDEAGRVVAQVDMVPRNWMYPTHWWEVEEFVMDTAVLVWDEVPSGSYWLWVGWYDGDTGERLVPDSEEAIDGAVPLTEVTR